MTPNLAFDFTVDKETKTITIEREFDAEVPMVWDAYTKSELLDQWWAPKPWKVKTKFMDFREGGRWHYAMVGPNGEQHWALLLYKTIVLLKSFSANDAFADENANINPAMPQSNWNVNFQAKSDKTLVASIIRYASLEQLEETLKMGFKEGLSMAMENLDALLVTLKK